MHSSTRGQGCTFSEPATGPAGLHCTKFNSFRGVSALSSSLPLFQDLPSPTTLSYLHQRHLLLHSQDLCQHPSSRLVRGGERNDRLECIEEGVEGLQHKEVQEQTRGNPRPLLSSEGPLLQPATLSPVGPVACRPIRLLVSHSHPR